MKTDLETYSETYSETSHSQLQRGPTVFMILVRASGPGIKREGLLYFEKYGTGGPEFGIKEEFVTERGRQLFHARE